MLWRYDALEEPYRIVLTHPSSTTDSVASIVGGITTTEEDATTCGPYIEEPIDGIDSVRFFGRLDAGKSEIDDVMTVKKQSGSHKKNDSESQTTTNSGWFEPPPRQRF
jgi:hypothetical protein